MVLALLIIVLLILISLLVADVVEYVTRSYYYNKYIHKENIKCDIFFIVLVSIMIWLL